MATNSSRGNPIGASNDAPPASDPVVPAVSEETKDQVSDSTGAYSSHTSGEDASAPGGTATTAKDQSVPEPPEGAVEVQPREERQPKSSGKH